MVRFLRASGNIFINRSIHDIAVAAGLQPTPHLQPRRYCHNISFRAPPPPHPHLEDKSTFLIIPPMAPLADLCIPVALLFIFHTTVVCHMSCL